MIVATWNVNSLSVRLPHLLSWLEANRPDVMCVQETKMIDDKFPMEQLSELGYHAVFTGEKSYNGVAILSRDTPDTVVKCFDTDSESAAKRFLEITLGPLKVVNVYIPNGSEVGSSKFAYKMEWIQMLRGHFEKYHKPDEMLVLCGDFNIATEDRDVYSVEAMQGQVYFTDDEHAAIQTVKDWGLVDTFRMHNEDAGFYSWWDYRVGAFRRNMGLRIDHIWASNALAPKCVKCWIDKEPRKGERPSDHVPVIAEFDI
jgi:exodeoxyribonuclease-3